MNTLALVAIFCVAAGVIWIAGSSLSKATDVFDEHFHLGEALGGLIFLAISTNLPEIAIVASASLHHDMGLAIGNILGGIAIQTVVLVLLDAAGMRKKGPLTYEAASLVLVLEALVLIGILILSITGTLMPRSLIFWRLTPINIAIATLWVVGLLLIRKARAEIPWQLREREAMHGAESSNAKREQPERITGTAVAFIVACVATLAAGVALEETSSMLAARIGMSGVLFGSTILAAATSLPEVTTGFASLRFGGYELAMSDIIGGNAFLPVLFVAATLLSGNPVLPDAKNTDVYLAGLGVLLTMIYAIGLLFRSKRKILGMGVDSLLVLGCYLVGLAGLFAVAHFSTK
ncbi:MAG: sodium:calcium antiporter [Candidatus Eremiobacteraeota bacterium]|nr:sodium:calcium antiporter [Candidatus Eremiobacteraeota bacterium]